MSFTVTGRGGTLRTATTLDTEICATCSVIFAVPTQFLAQRRNDGKNFYCPNGHSLSFGTNKEQRLEQQLKNARDRNARVTAELDQTKSALHGQKSRAGRFKNDRDRERERIAHGTCPCCDATFADLAAHMADQHPGHATPTED